MPHKHRHDRAPFLRGHGTRPDHEPDHPAVVSQRVEAAARRSVPREGACVAVCCWCEATVVEMPLAMVLDGLTGSCGRVECVPPAAR